jgi:hypothetical protein
MADYLDAGERALNESTTAEEFKQRMTARFPDHGCGKALDHELRFLFH